MSDLDKLLRDGGKVRADGKWHTDRCWDGDGKWVRKIGDRFDCAGARAALAQQPCDECGGTRKVAFAHVGEPWYHADDKRPCPKCGDAQ